MGYMRAIFLMRAILVIRCSVPARFGKGQGAKEIGHNLVRKRQKIGHILESERPSWAHFYAWMTKIQAQSSTQTKQDLGTILWAIDDNMGPNQLSENTKTEIICIFVFFALNSGRALCKSGRAQGSSGRVRDSAGRAQHPQKYA